MSTEPIGRFSRDGRTITLTEPLSYTSLLASIVVRAGKVSDFHSVPRFCWRLFAPWEYPRAGVVHDALYDSGIYSRLVADRVHLVILIEDGMPVWKAVCVYALLRACGWKAWANHRRIDQESAAVPQ